MTPTLPTCPDLWSGSFAKDGLLLRMRIPGGILTVPQCEAIAHFVMQSGSGYMQVTNRANLQIRELQTAIAPDTFRQFQELGLASRTVSVDSLRNVMASPTAGFDAQMLVDTRPLVSAWDDYLQTHPELAALSPKFSVGLDGGEAVSMGDRHNDIVLSAERLLTGVTLAAGVTLFPEALSTVEPTDLVEAAPTTAFRLYLAVEGGVSDTGILIPPQHSISLLAALARVYLDYSQGRQRPDGRKPRLRHVIAEWGMMGYLDRVQQCLPASLPVSVLQGAIATADHPRPRSSQARNRIAAAHLGIHSQRQPGLSYIGLALPLGRLEASQLRSLAALTQTLAQTVGSGTLRLTPWQTLILPDIPTAYLASVQTQLAELGFHWSALRPDSLLVACSGSRGCASAATDTHAQALALITHLETCLVEESLTLTQPLNIHISGCEKSCAQHSPLDVALVGQSISAAGSMEKAYDLYVGAAAMPFGRRVFQAVGVTAVPMLLEQMIRVYQREQQPQESFGNFCDRHSIAQLQQWFQPQTAANRVIWVTS